MGKTRPVVLLPTTGSYQVMMDNYEDYLKPLLGQISFNENFPYHINNSINLLSKIKKKIIKNELCDLINSDKYT